MLIVLRALTLRRILVDRPYRSRAFWMAVGGASMIFLILALSYDLWAAPLGILSDTLASFALVTAFWGVAIIGLFGWIVSNVNVSLEADFFHRDAVLWRRGGGSAVLAAAVALYVVDTVLGSAFSPSVGNLVGQVVTAAYLAIIAYAVAAVVLTYSRIGDREVKAYTKWVALSFVALLVTGTLWYVLASVPAILMVYCMYRSAGKLSIRTRAMQ